MQDSLAGRAESVEMHGFSQGELRRTPETFGDRVFAGDDLVGHAGALTHGDYLEAACAGSYPESLARSTGRRRAAWIDNYVQRIVECDAADISTNLSHRVVRRPKVALLDTGLAARLLSLSATGAMSQGEQAGPLLEAFVAGELRRQLSWSEQPIRISHHRDHGGAEVDLILEADDGRIVGIEVKASASISGRDTRWLAQLRDKLGDRFAMGLLLHTGTTSSPFGDRLVAASIDSLWAA